MILQVDCKFGGSQYNMSNNSNKSNNSNNHSNKSNNYSKYSNICNYNKIGIIIYTSNNNNSI